MALTSAARETRMRQHTQSPVTPPTKCRRVNHVLSFHLSLHHQGECNSAQNE